MKNHEKNNSRFFRDFFVFQKKSFEKIFLSISIRNFPRIPKIALRNSCDEYKDPKYKKIRFFSSKCTDLTVNLVNPLYNSVLSASVNIASAYKCVNCF